MSTPTDTLPEAPNVPDSARKGGCSAVAGSLFGVETTLLRVAASMLKPGVFLSPFREDHPKRTPRQVVKAAEAQQEQLQRWASELAAAARSLRKANESSAGTAD